MRSVNLIPFLAVNPVYSFYFNLNILGTPVSITLIFWVISFIGILLFGCSSIQVFLCAETGKWKKHHFFWRKQKGAGSMNLVRHEIYKIIIEQRGWMILLLPLALQLGMYHLTEHEPSIDEVYYKSYMEKFQGDWDEEKQQWIEAEQLRFVQLHQRYENIYNQYENGLISETERNVAIQSILQEIEAENAFQRVKDQLSYIKKNENKKYPMIYELGYQKLMAKEEYLQDMWSACIVIFSFLLLFSGSYANEWKTGMEVLIFSSVRGRKDTLIAKLKAAVITGVFVFIFTYLPEIMVIIFKEGMPFLNTSIKALPHFRDNIFDLPIWLHLCLVYCIRLGAFFIVLCAAIALGTKLKNALYAVLGGVLLFLFPIILSRFGWTWIDWMTLNPLFSGNLLLNEYSKTGFFGFIGVCIVIIVGVCSFVYSEVGQD